MKFNLGVDLSDIQIKILEDQAIPAIILSMGLDPIKDELKKDELDMIGHVLELAWKIYKATTDNPKIEGFVSKISTAKNSDQIGIFTLGPYSCEFCNAPLSNNTMVKFFGRYCCWNEEACNKTMAVSEKRVRNAAKARLNGFRRQVGLS